MSRNFLLVAGLSLSFAFVGCGMLLNGQSARADDPAGDSPAPQPAAGATLFGFSTFPYDTTAASMDNLYKLGRDHGQIFVVQRDNGIPWKEALDDKPLPAKVMNDWAEFLKHKPAGQPFYLSIAPLDFDRTHLAGACDGSSMPDQIKGAAFDSKPVKTAYLNYCRDAVKYFKPDYLNIGVEAGEMAQRAPSTWPAFARLIEYVRSNLKKDNPNLKIGISFGLQSLMQPDAANRAKALVESCDYLGLSFYPYMSNFHEKYGDKPLPPPPDEWLQALKWVRSYTSKPIAVCETGYNTSDVALSANNIALKGSPDWQQRYIEDLTAIAKSDGYLFVIWYFPVDLDRFFASLPDQGGAAVLWEKNGLFDKDMKPKPALAAWDNAVLNRPTPSDSVAGSGDSAGPSTPAPKPTIFALNFANNSDLFSVPANEKIKRLTSGGPNADAAMEWHVSYANKDFAWASKKLTAGKLAGATQMSLWVKSDGAGPIIVQLKENTGEVYSSTIDAPQSWTQVTVPLANFACDPAHRKNGQLEANKLVEIVLADGGANDGKTGERNTDFAGWQFQ